MPPVIAAVSMTLPGMALILLSLLSPGRRPASRSRCCISVPDAREGRWRGMRAAVRTVPVPGPIYGPGDIDNRGRRVVVSLQSRAGRPLLALLMTEEGKGGDA